MGEHKTNLVEKLLGVSLMSGDFLKPTLRDPEEDKVLNLWVLVEF